MPSEGFGISDNVEGVKILRKLIFSAINQTNCTTFSMSPTLEQLAANFASLHGLTAETIEPALEWITSEINRGKACKEGNMELETKIVYTQSGSIRHFVPPMVFKSFKSVIRYESYFMSIENVLHLFCKPETYLLKFLTPEFAELQESLCAEKNLSLGAYCEYVSCFRNIDKDNQGEISIPDVHKFIRYLNTKISIEELYKTYNKSTESDMISFEEFVKLGDIKWDFLVSSTTLKLVRDLFEQMDEKRSGKVCTEHVNIYAKLCSERTGLPFPVLPNSEEFTLNQFISFCISTPIAMILFCDWKYLSDYSLDKTIQKFKKMKKNSSDSVSVQDFMDSKYFDDVSEDSVRSVIGKFDKNGDGCLNLMEFCSLEFETFAPPNLLNFVTGEVPCSLKRSFRDSSNRMLVLILAFRLLDTNRNGFVTAEEYHYFIHKYGSSELKQKLTLELMHKAFPEFGDSDADGKISLEDFINADRVGCSSPLPREWDMLFMGDLEAQYAILFDLYDTDGTGVIDVFTFSLLFHYVLKCIGQIPLVSMMRIVEAISNEKNPFVTREEVIETLRTKFSVIASLNISISCSILV